MTSNSKNQQPKRRVRSHKRGKVYEQKFPKIFNDPIFMHHAIAAFARYLELNPLPEGDTLSTFRAPADIDTEKQP